MIKKALSFILVVCALISIISIDTKADIGPKATADITIVGVDEPYYFDLLIYKNYDVEPIPDTEAQDIIEWEYYDDTYPLDALNGYQDSQGYASRTLYSGPPGSTSRVEGMSDTYRAGYFSAPKVFKIVIVIDDDIIITSKIIDRKLFTSTMTYDLTGVDLSFSQENVGVVSETIPYGHFSLTLIIRVIITIAAELLVLYMFRYRQKSSFYRTGLTNLVTQTTLTLFMTLAFYFWGSFFGLLGVLIFGEMIVFIAEIVLYRYILTEQSKSRAMLYGFVANLVTLILTVFTLGFI
ncbi:MAG: hypothetical protein K8Q99_04825 [Acholeplasmataceae bacterium]|nr:hypothetical protein [Acholeplasmataceae bacterium]